MEERRYTVKEIAYMESISVRTVYRWIEEGFLITKRNPTQNRKGRMVITEAQYQEFKELFNKGGEDEQRVS